MRRWFVVLLIMILSLQVSWAAVHVDHAADAHAVQHDPGEPDDLATVEPAAADSEAHPCCAANHGCHGLHSAMPAPTLVLRLGAGDVVLNPPQQHMLTALFASRHERPKWSAA